MIQKRDGASFMDDALAAHGRLHDYSQRLLQLLGSVLLLLVFNEPMSSWCFDSRERSVGRLDAQRV